MMQKTDQTCACLSKDRRETPSLRLCRFARSPATTVPDSDDIDDDEMDLPSVDAARAARGLLLYLTSSRLLHRWFGIQHRLHTLDSIKITYEAITTQTPLSALDSDDTIVTASLHAEPSNRTHHTSCSPASW